MTNCLTRWCKGTEFIRVSKPANYTTRGVDLDWHRCTACGSEWVEGARDLNSPSGRNSILRELHEAAKEARARPDNAKFEGIVS